MDSKSPQYFDVFRALHRGGLSLWLNRRTLMPMTLVPIIVTFLTLMVIRANFTDGEMPSSFVMALMQIPSDFVTGIFCSLIIFIIMNAPKKGDKDAPVVFSLNIMERKDLLVAGAIAYVVFGYLAAGILGLMQMVFVPIQAASQAEEAPNMIHIILFFGLVGFVLYAIRMILLPILIIGKIDVLHFYNGYKKLGFSLPIFVVKLATSISAGLFIFIVLGAFSGGGENTSPIQMAIIDFATAFGSVISSAWAMAALSIGVRKMLEGGE